MTSSENNHSIAAYLRRQPVETLESIMYLYMEGISGEHFDGVLPDILNALREAEKRGVYRIPQALLTEWVRYQTETEKRVGEL